MRYFTAYTYRFILVVFLSGFTGIISPASGQSMFEFLKVLPTDGAESESFGIAIDIDGGIVAVGKPSDDDNGYFSGSVYLFNAVTGVQFDKLHPSDGAEDDQFGGSVAIDDGIVVVGAWHNEDNGWASGSAYLFDAFTGVQLAKLLPLDGEEGDNFGMSVAIGDGIVAIGARLDDDSGDNAGAVYLFDAYTGVQLHKLLAADGEGGESFAYVAIDDGIVAVGAPNDNDNGASSGSAYLFDASTGVQLFKLLPNYGATNDRFGSSIAIDNGIVVVGAKYDDPYGQDSGSAYIFDATTGAQTYQLTNHGLMFDEFGFSVGISNGIVAVGARREDAWGPNSGAGYLFNAFTGSSIIKLYASDGATYDEFGTSIAIDNGMIAVGAIGDDDNGAQSGSAYVFKAECINLSVENLVAGDLATFRISGGTPGEKAVTVYGLAEGQTVVDDILGYCATFEIAGVNQSRIVGGLNYTFDEFGEITFNQFVPPAASGITVFIQSAERGSCPDDCMSNLVEAVVQ